MLPMFEQRKMDHIRFQRTEIDRPRYKKPFGPTPHQRNNTEYGGSLNEKVKVVIKSFQQAIETEPPEFDPAFIFKIKIEGMVSDDDWRKSNLTVLSEEQDGAVVLFSSDQLSEFRSRVGAYSEPIPEGQKNPHYVWIANLTEEIQLWGRENRIGKKLRGITIDPETEYTIDIELWVYGRKEENDKRLNSLRQFVEQNGGSFLDKYQGDDLCLARVKLLGVALDRLLEVGDIREVDLPPEPALEMPNFYQSRLDDFSTPITSPDPNSPGICVIDSGLATGHPMLAQAIGDAQTFPGTLGTEIDQNGHGTMVGGLALYGDVQACIDNLSFTPQLFLYSARVTNSQNLFDDESLIISQIEQSIKYFYDTYGCRVFNVSLADPFLVYDDGKPSSWANALDLLARKYDIVIVVSAGNIALHLCEGAEAEYFRAKYPSYLLLNEARILEPSTAINTITVGSISQSEISFQAGLHPTDIIEPIGKVNWPSPFTRSGPGVNGSVKPDVVEYGGNSLWYAFQKRILPGDPGLDVVSTNHDYRQRLFAAMSGTSFSTPRVAFLAGLILKKYPEISANLVRALIASAAEIPEVAHECFNNDDDIRKVYGYGLPALEKALYSTDNRVLLLAEDTIAIDTIHIYEIPIPEIFRTTKGERRLSICLAYDPPVRNTRKEYIGINMEFRLIRGCTINQIVGWHSERIDGTNPIPDNCDCKLTPSPTKREGGTLQKAEFRVSQNRAFENYPGEHFYLLVRSLKGWAPKDEFPEQRYAVTVTLEHLAIQIDLYNSLRNSVRIDLRDRARLRA